MNLFRRKIWPVLLIAVMVLCTGCAQRVRVPEMPDAMRDLSSADVSDEEDAEAADAPDEPTKAPKEAETTDAPDEPTRAPEEAETTDASDELTKTPEEAETTDAPDEPTRAPEEAETTDAPDEPTKAPEQTDAEATDAPDEPTKVPEEDPSDYSDNPDDTHIEDQNSDHKEYDDNSDAAIDEKKNASIAKEQEGTSEGGADGEQISAVITDAEAEHYVTIDVANENADDYGISADGAQADSAVIYYMTLLKKLDSAMFECQKYYVYFEDEAEYLTVHKSSAEHDVVLMSGAYDVSAKLTEAALQVDGGWVGRKNPGAIVKAVDSAVLGAGVSATAAAEAILDEIMAREDLKNTDAVRHGRVMLISKSLFANDAGKLAAAMYLAYGMYPSEFENVDPLTAHMDIFEEAGASFKDGIYFYAR